MKTLDQIISRQDYVRVNEALKARAKELAEIFAKKFDELCGAWDTREHDFPPYLIKVNGHEYCAMRNIYRSNGVQYTDGIRFVLYDWWEELNDYCPKSLNRTKYGQEASFYDYVNFFNDAKDILSELDEKENELVKDAEQAIENAKDITLKNGGQQHVHE